MTLWEYWRETKYEPIISEPDPVLYGGTNTEPEASIGMASFLDAVRDNFKEGFSVIDYGCGAGILANFISARLEDFVYYGLEPHCEYGRERLNTAKFYFSDDERLLFAYTNRYAEFITEPIDLVVLISVFTHFDFDHISKMLDDLIMIFDYNPDAAIVFSCFPADKAKEMYPMPEISDGYHGVTHVELESIIKYCNRKGLTIIKHTNFVSFGGYNHEIFKIVKD